MLINRLKLNYEKMDRSSAVAFVFAGKIPG
jgi:hypothetical protein